eukprot:NODE_64_length_26047_cov_1.706837.p13 type:complete len:175 gc:universal NODE_64_length_26047_cov_1.706837:22175-22699(+)
MQECLTVALVCIFVEIVKRIGFSTCSTLLYNFVYGGKDVSALKKEIYELEVELKKTSAMDEFAKWAKIRRQLDTATKKQQDMMSDESMKKLKVQIKVTSGLWILTNVMHACCSLYYRYEPMFYLPKILGPLNDWVHLPFAPLGSVSVVIWYFTVQRTANLLFDTIIPIEKEKEQ